MSPRFFILPAFFLLNSTVAYSQFYGQPNEYFFGLITERQLAEPAAEIHAGLKPFVPFFSKKYEHVGDTHRVFKFIKQDPGVDLIFNDHFVQIQPKNENYKLRLDPLMEFGTGWDYIEKDYREVLYNSRGVMASGSIKDNFYFESSFVENQTFYPTYIYQQALRDSVVPGYGRYKVFRYTGFDYGFSTGMISIKLGKHVNLQLGHGKQKIGNGYRSILLSDNAFNYPYLRLTHEWFGGKVQYTNIYAQLSNLAGAAKIPTPNTERLFQHKAAQFQYVSCNLSKYINVSFFQGLIWEPGDERNRQYLGLGYFNPLIYSQVLTYGLNSNRNNIIAGGDVKVKLHKKLNLYGQLMADRMDDADTTGNKWGVQAGMNWFDFLGVRNLFVQSEYNYVADGSYKYNNSRYLSSSYSHYHQDLAFTQGTGQEFIVLADYRHHRAFANVHYHYQVVPQNGKDLYYNNSVHARLGYMINKAYNLSLSIGYIHRNQNFYNFRANSNETSYLYVNLRTHIFNQYYDF